MSDLSRIRFLESLDSVRFAPPSFGAVPDRDAAMTQAKVECALTLLFGERIVLPEPYSFDSSAVLEFGVDLVSNPSAT